MATKTPPSQPSSSSSSSRRTCLCAPTTHPGSFRCARHRKVSAKPKVGGGNRVHQSKMEAAAAAAVAATSKASLIKAILFQIIKPSSHDLQRRRNFRPKPSRFCLMNSTADGRVAVS
ncbi:hypothetical protein SLEP1_g52509 [Rubroshorea leprosula]|uniref:Uncharacterized protein n=1 Tax=Rubroshorea leprosula TaxID=152421 RepID=A0AAV5MA98_9ROSI|nr:hypothetical protein SLEP1_g52509 [Rubroshorea leprosula]